MRRHVHRGRHAVDVVASDLANLLPCGASASGTPSMRVALEDQIAEDAVDAVLHLVREALP